MNNVLKWIEFHNSPDEAVKQIAKDQYNRNPIMLAYRAEYVVATELSGAGDAMRIGLGLDPYTGEKLGWEKRQSELKSFIFFDAFSKALKITPTLNKISKLPSTYSKATSVASGLQKEFDNNE